jgi:hypothetical protein
VTYIIVSVFPDAGYTPPSEARTVPELPGERFSVANPKSVSNNGRTVHAVRIKLHCVADRSVIVWLNDTAKLCVQLLNGRRTWTTARAGDAVWLSHNGQKTREHIESVELYRVFPTSANGEVVKSAWH